MSGIFKGV